MSQSAPPSAPSSPPAAPAAAPAEAPPAPPRTPISMGSVTLGLLFIYLGVAWLLSGLGVEMSAAVVGSTVLILVGFGLLVSTLRSEPDGSALGVATTVGVLVAVMMLVATVVRVPPLGGVGDRVYEPTAVAELDDAYRLSMGTQTVDLRQIAFPEGTTRVEVSTLLGEAVVLVDADVDVQVDASAFGGSVEVFDEASDGMGVDVAVETSGFDDASQRVILDVRVGFGEVRVDR